MRIVNTCKGPVFPNKVGRMKMEAVELKYEARFKEVQPACYPVPYHYQERLATHLRKLEAEGLIEKVTPVSRSTAS